MDRSELEEKLANLVFLKKQTAEVLANWEKDQSLDVIGDTNAFQAVEDKMEDLDKEIEETREELRIVKGE